MKKIAVVVNPSSAGGRSLKAWPQFEQKLRANGFRIISHTSKNAADFRNQVRLFSRDFKTIAVCGGDSSLTIAAEELLAAKFSGELKFLPAGSVNDIVLDIRESRATEKNTAYLGSLVTANLTKIFIGQSNWGLGVVVNRWVGKTLRALPFLRPLQNFIGTLCIVFAHLLGRERVRVALRTEKETVSGDYSVVLVSQIRHWASGLLFSPDASYKRPHFQIVTIRRCSLVRLVRIILAAKRGEHFRFPEVESRSAREVWLTSAAPLAVQIDGDILRNERGEILERNFVLKKKRSALHLAL